MKAKNIRKVWERGMLVNNDLVSRSALLDIVGKMPLDWEYGQAVSDIYDIIKNAPTVDAAELVRCKDCKHVLEKHYEEPGEPPYIKYLGDCPYGLSNRYGVDKNDFCSRGEH